MRLLQALTLARQTRRLSESSVHTGIVVVVQDGKPVTQIASWYRGLGDTP